MLDKDLAAGAASKEGRSTGGRLIGGREQGRKVNLHLEEQANSLNLKNRKR